MITKKSINAALPRLDELRRSFLLPGSTGLIPYPNMRHLRCAKLDYDPETRQATRCVVYGVGDALELDHYYETDCIDITAAIIEWMSDCDTDRKACVQTIWELAQELFDKSKGEPHGD